MTTNSAVVPLVFSAASGALAALVVALGAWLSPLSAADRAALALMAVTMALPLGCVNARPTASIRAAALALAGGLLAGVTLATCLTIFEPALWVRTAVWCGGAALLGTALAGLAGRVTGALAALAWLFLNGLPFFYDRLPWLARRAEAMALEGAPWLGFSMDAFGGDPLRRPVIYMNKLSELTSIPAQGTLTAGALWAAAVPLAAALLLLKAFFERNSNRQ